MWPPGTPLTAQAGAEVLRAGGNAVDAAVAAMLMSFAAEPLLTGLGAGGHMLVAGADEEPALLDFFVQAPARRQDGGAARAGGGGRVVRRRRAGLLHRPGLVRGLRDARGRVRGDRALGDDAAGASSTAPAARARARGGRGSTRGQAYVAEILADLLTSTPECAALWAPHGRVLREGELLRNPELGDALERAGRRQGAEPFYRGDDRARGVRVARRSAGARSSADRRSPPTAAIEREPVRVRYRDRTVLTNPPPSAGGTLLAYSLALLDRGPQPPPLDAACSRRWKRRRPSARPEFVRGARPRTGFLERFLRRQAGLHDAHLGARLPTGARAA